jgi:CheY-like chemotaxis protein
MRNYPNFESVNSAATALARETEGRSVLIAEDHEDTRLMLRTILEMNRYFVMEASNGREAVELAELERPDIILMDFILPLLDGLTALRLIRASKINGDVPVIILSGQADPAPQMAAREAGCNDYLVKPFELDHMLQLIERRLRPSAECTGAVRFPEQARERCLSEL